MHTAPTNTTLLSYQTVQGQPSLVNLLTREPPQYLVASSCESAGEPASINGSQSQIEQIMARYEQLCRKLEQ